VFFIALGDVDRRRAVLGFASDYCIEGWRHGPSVYVRGRSARQGIGSALLARAEAHAAETGATSIEIEASLAGVDFYRAHVKGAEMWCGDFGCPMEVWRGLD
jgi:GNAT superfamily N-acetyltransferase